MWGFGVRDGELLALLDPNFIISGISTLFVFLCVLVFKVPKSDRGFISIPYSVVLAFLILKIEI